jgi:2-oxoglutarate ferredoxin oxidoreductase subunit delta
MERLRIDTHRCKGCGLCEEFCPRHILELSEGLNAIGYHPAQLKDAEQCTSCALCAQMCPETGISVYRKRREGHE